MQTGPDALLGNLYGLKLESNEKSRTNAPENGIVSQYEDKYEIVCA